MRPVAGLLTGVLLTVLVGCGGNPTDDYCSSLEKHRKEIAEMVESGSADALLDHLPMLRDLAEQSPDDLADEWQTYLGALDGLDAALRDAGVKPSEFEDGEPPADLSAAQRKSIVEAADQVATDDVVQASSGIEQQARDVCKINLGL